MICNMMSSDVCCMHCGRHLSETLCKSLCYAGFDLVICKDCLQNKKEEINSEFVCKYIRQVKILVLNLTKHKNAM